MYLFTDDILVVLNSLYKLDEEQELTSQRLHDPLGVLIISISLLVTFYRCAAWDSLVITKLDTVLVFFILVAGVSCIIIGIYVGKFMLYFCALVATIPFCVVLQLVFSTTCCIFENSQTVLRKWLGQAKRMRDAGYLKREVMALRVLAMPAGNAGIMVRDIKMNYYNGILNWVASIFMLFSDRMATLN